MADSKIRLQIVTALDNAGIKATQDQINKLESQLKRVNTSGGNSLGGLNGQLIKMPGKIGNVVGGLGKMAGGLGKIGLVIGVVYAGWKTFTQSLKAGHEIFKQFGDGASFSLESIRNGFINLGNSVKESLEKAFFGISSREAAEKANEVAKAIAEDRVNYAKQAADKQIEALQAVRDEHQKNIDKIKQETNTYINQAQAVAGLKAAGTNANVVLWEAEKAQMMQQYTDQGDDEAAQQVGKAYDLMIAKEKADGVARQNLYNLNKASRSIEGKTSQLEAQMRMTDDLAAQYNEAKANFEKAKETKGRVGTRTALQWKRAMDRAQKEYEASLLKEQPLNDQIIADYNSYKALQINSASAYETAFRDVRAKYNKYYETGYGPVDIQFGDSMKNIEQESAASYNALLQIANNTQEMTNLADILRELLSIKR